MRGPWSVVRGPWCGPSRYGARVGRRSTGPVGRAAAIRAGRKTRSWRCSAARFNARAFSRSVNATMPTRRPSRSTTGSGSGRSPPCGRRRHAVIRRGRRRSQGEGEKGGNRRTGEREKGDDRRTGERENGRKRATGEREKEDERFRKLLQLPVRAYAPGLEVPAGLRGVTVGPPPGATSGRWAYGCSRSHQMRTRRAGRRRRVSTSDSPNRRTMSIRRGLAALCTTRTRSHDSTTAACHAYGEDTKGVIVVA
jgi:hypothetical protein